MRRDVRSQMFGGPSKHEMGSLLGVPMGTRSLEELVDVAEQSIVGRSRPFVLACANPHSLVIAQRDREFLQALRTCGAVVADGVGCKLGAKLSGVSIGPRITGYDVFQQIMSRLDRSDGRVFFLGSTEDTLGHIVRRSALEFPRVAVGTLSPPFGYWSEEANGRILRGIKEFQPDVLWVGMTAPKQEKWVASNIEELQAIPVICSIGAAFDYYAGVVPRAPRWARGIGLEWLYRLPREPARLWKRTLISAPVFLWLALRHRLFL